MIVTIKRQKNRESSPYLQSFRYDGTLDTTVAALLDALNYTDDLYDTEKKKQYRYYLQNSCQQKVCGACAMVINSTPALACNTFLRDLKCDKLVLEPLSKFPVTADLIVDRSVIDENLKKAEVYLGELAESRAKEYPQQYSTAKCLKCGLCLEVCPNYTKGDSFFGALFANNVYLIQSQSGNRKKDLKKKYDANFAAGCSKSLSC